jgi:hypothetical protein
MQLNFTPVEVSHINQCQLFLQVLTIADISTADGTQILQTAVDGVKDASRISRLQWPRQPRPPESAWYTWGTFLQHLSTNRRLQRPLGPWTCHPHQIWQWYTNKEASVVYRYNPTLDTWICNHPTTITTGARQTRQTRRWFSDKSHPMHLPPPSPIFPTTVVYHPTGVDHYFLLPSASPFPPSENEPPPATWDRTRIPPILANTPDFYQRLIGPAPDLSESIQLSLAHGMELETLMACSDGSVTKGTGSHGWIFVSDTNPTLQGAGPDDGHPDHMTSYRSELGGLLAVLYIIYRVCSAYDIQAGKVNYYCDNKGVIQNVFHPSCQPSITSFLATDSDLVYTARSLLDIIPITIIGTWVKGHQKDDKDPKHVLNNTAGKLARDFLQHHPPRYRPKRLPTALPNYRVRLFYDDSVITSNLYSIPSTSLHQDSLKAYIIKKTGWAPATFDLVNWTAHGRAFNRLPQNQQISTAKLIHNLANTNHQSHVFYNKPNTCPCCNVHEETFQHVLRCSAAYVCSHRDSAIQELTSSLNKCNTPPNVTNAILHGIKSWLELDLDDTRPIRAPTVGSLKAADVILTAAFHEQFNTIGWYQFLLGRLSKKWETAVSAYTSIAGPTPSNQQWTTQIILSM